MSDKPLAELDDPPSCPGCGALAGACEKYPNCYGNPEWRRMHHALRLIVTLGSQPKLCEQAKEMRRVAQAGLGE
jgi:hypothetical protein